MRALPTLGGNNRQASAINNRGQIVGMAEDGTRTPHALLAQLIIGFSCRCCGKTAKSRLFPRVTIQAGSQLWINDDGQAVGYTGACGAIWSHAVSWENGTVTVLKDLGTGFGALAYGKLARAKLLGQVFAVGLANGGIRYGAIWQNSKIYSPRPASDGRYCLHSHRHQQPGPGGGKAPGTPTLTGPMPSSIRTAC